MAASGARRRFFHGPFPLLPLLLLFVVSTAAPCGAADVPGRGGVAAGTDGHVIPDPPDSVAADGPAPPGTFPEEAKINWSFDMGTGRVIATPTTWKHVVFAYGYREGDAGGILVAIDARNGSLLWDFAFPEVPRTERLKPPVVFDTRDGSCIVYVVASSENLFAMNHSDPSLPMWRFSPSSLYTSRPVIGRFEAHGVARAVLHVTADINNATTMLYAFDAIIGPSEELWRTKLNAASGIATAPTYLRISEENRSLVVVVLAKTVIAYDPQFSPPRIVFELATRGVPISREAPSVGYSDLVKFDVLYFTVKTEDGEYIGWAVDPFGGRMWEVPLATQSKSPNTVLTDPTAAGQGTFVSYTEYDPSEGGMVVGLAATDGEFLWRLRDYHGTPNFSRPVASQDTETVLILVQSYAMLSIWEIDSKGAFLSSYNVQQQCTLRDRALENPPSAFHLAGRIAYIPGIDHNLYSMNLLAPPRPYVPPVAAGNDTVLFLWMLGGAALFTLVALFCVPRFWELGWRAKLMSPARSDGQGRPGSLGNDGSNGVNAELRYNAIRKLGAGMFGAVYLVQSRQDSCYYAMKRIPCNSDQERSEALREWRILCDIQHPHKITAYESFVSWSVNDQEQRGCILGEDGEGDEGCGNNSLNLAFRRYLCIVMRYYPEGDLRQYLKSLQPDAHLPEGVILRYTAQVSSLLSLLHAKSPPIIHRDLKPENLLLADNYSRIVVTDFGLAKIVDRGSYLQTHAGTFAYISPETWDRHYSTGADVWALGCIMYAMLSKRVSNNDIRCFWREAFDPDFQTNLVAEVTQQYGYTEFFGSTVARLLTPDRRRRPSAAQVLEWAEPRAVPPVTPVVAPQPAPKLLGARPSPSKANGSTRGANM